MLCSECFARCDSLQKTKPDFAEMFRADTAFNVVSSFYCSGRYKLLQVFEDSLDLTSEAANCSNTQGAFF